ncbi:MAG: hypothetical protein U0R19_39520 [Bryobacteraceae bacterium]
MKKKPKEEPTVISKEIIQRAKAAIFSDSITPVTKCTVCGGDAAPNSTESLCWVCRRLKISAWRDADQQMAASE